MAELVTLEAPDGRRYKTDSQSEINLLVGTYGYRRVPSGSEPRRKSTTKPKPAVPAAEPPSAPSNNTEPDDS